MIKAKHQRLVLVGVALVALMGAALLAVWALHIWYPLHNEFALDIAKVWGTNIVVLVVGVVIGSVGSAIAIRRVLDV